MSKPSNIPIDKIRLEGGTQVRVMLDDDLIKRYAALMAEEQDLDPILLYYDGENYWLVDGFHRVGAARENGKSTILAIVKKRTKEEAIWDSLSVNNRHGKPLSSADRTSAIKKAIRIHPEYTDNRIAKELCVDHKTVTKYRAEGEAKGEVPHVTERHGSDGRKTTPPTQPKDKAGKKGKGKKEPSPTSDTDDIPFKPTTSKDQVGNPITGKIAADFARRQEILVLMQKLSEVKMAVAEHVEQRDLLFADLNPTAFQAEITNCYRRLSMIQPHALCPYCKGDGCRACKDRGWVCKTIYDTAPEDMKA